MQYILLITLILLIFLFLLIFRNDFLSPSVTFTLPFLFSAVFLFVNKNFWSITIYSKTYFIILFGVLFLFWGELISRAYTSRIYIKKKKKYEIDNGTLSQSLKSKKYMTNLIIIYMIGVLIWYFYHVYSIGSLLRNSNMTLLGSYRRADKLINPVLNIGIKSSLPIAYFYLYAFLNSYIFDNKKIVQWLIPVILYLGMTILSSGRIEFIYTIISGLAIFYILTKKKYNWKMAFNFKMIRIGILAMTVIFIGFYLLGFLTGKSNYNNFFNIISLYAGSSILALNDFLVDFNYNITDFGSETLYGITNLFRIFGIDMGITESRFLEFIHVGTMIQRTNIYTSFRRLLNDYGYIGMFFIQFMTGFIFSNIYCKIKYDKYKFPEFGILLYIYFIRYLALSFTDERIIMNIFTITTILQVGVLLILVKYVRSKKKV